MSVVPPRQKIGGPLLAALARWPAGRAEDATEFVDSIVLFGDPQLAKLALDQKTGKELRALYRFKDSVLAMGGQYPLVEALKRTKAELGVTRFRKAQEQARRILEDLVSWASSRKELVMEKHPALNIVRRPVQHRFILPMRAMTSNPLARPTDVPGWGCWQPVITTFDDLLSWATANVLATDSARNLGRCQQCGQYYYSHRPTRHRFCADRDCRDRYWRERTGAERIRRSRAKRTREMAEHLRQIEPR